MEGNVKYSIKCTKVGKEVAVELEDVSNSYHPLHGNLGSGVHSAVKIVTCYIRDIQDRKEWKS